MSKSQLSVPKVQRPDSGTSAIAINNIEGNNMYDNLTTRQLELVKAIKISDYQYLLDCNVLNEENINFTIDSNGATPFMIACAIGK